MLYYPNKHYQSIVPKIEKTVIDDNTSQIKTLDQVEQVEIKTLDQQRSTKKLKVSVDTSEERNSNQLNKNSSPYNLRRRWKDNLENEFMLLSIIWGKTHLENEFLLLNCEIT